MSQLIIFLLGLIAGVVGLWLMVRGRSGGIVINPEQQRTRRENLTKVLVMAKEKGSIVNDDVEKSLGISNATAERYLQELEAQGTLEQVGTTGKYVTYRPR